MSLEDLRRQYLQGGLPETNLPAEPTELFSQWLAVALAEAPADWVEPYAMTLATSTRDGDVSARIVLLRGVDESGFVFYTNYDSRKGQDLAENPRAALVFHWGYLERQVRVQGTIEKTARSLSATYFHRRPRGSQISAAISRQSAPVASRQVLEEQAQQLEQQLEGGQVPLPTNWGGYRVQPTQIEFWQGRQDRLHDRILFQREGATWSTVRLSP